MSRIFLSHSSKDDFAAVAVRDWLGEEGWDDVFLDLDPARGIHPGERWERALNEAANRCEAVLFLVSRNWLASDWCRSEYELARRLNKRIFVVRIEDIAIADLPLYLRETYQSISLAAGGDHLLRRVVRPGTHEERHVHFSAEGLARLKAGLGQAGLDPRFFAWPPPSEPQRAPYRGLEPLETVDAGIFFGRDGPIIEAVDALRGLRDAAAPRLFVILGASGAGKSSFLRAGLLPRLARDDRNFLPLPIIRPERAAINGANGLVAALAAAAAARALDVTRARLREAVGGGARALRPILSNLTGGALQAGPPGETATMPPTLTIAIDQAEELFRAEGAAEGEALLTLLRDLASADEPAVIAIFAIRSDAYDALEQAKPLEGLRQQTFALLPMPRGAYQTVIEGPAKRLAQTGRKFEIDPALVQSLLEDVDKGGGGDALPLLAFTLEQLYRDYGAAKRLARADYQSFGGLAGAMDAAISRVFAAADADARIPKDHEARLALLRRGLIPWLAGVDPETRTPRRRRAPAAQIPEEARPLIDLLVEQRLLTRDFDKSTSETTIEPAHEALLRQWGRLKGWLEEDFGRLATLEGVKRAARDWDANARRPAWAAHGGARLEEADRLDARPDLAALLEATDRAYLSQCRAREEAARARANRARMFGWGVAAAFAVAIVVSWSQYQSWRQNRIETKLFDFRTAVKQCEGKFITHLPRPKSMQEGIVECQRVSALVEEIKLLQGRPPEGWEDATAKAHEFRAVLFAELGDPEASLREVEASKAISTSRDRKLGLNEVLSRNPAMMSYVLTVFDLMMELAVADERTRVALRESPALKEALKQGASTNGEPAKPDSPPTTAPPDDGHVGQRNSLEINRYYVRLLEYMTSQYQRDRDFQWLWLFRYRMEAAYEKLEEWDQVRQLKLINITTDRRRLELARGNLWIEPYFKETVVVDAARSLGRDQLDLAEFYLRRGDFEQALAAAREGLQTTDTEPELSSSDDLRFALRKIAADALLRLDRGKDAIREAQLGSNRMLEASQMKLRDTWAQVIKAYGDVAEYWTDFGTRWPAKTFAGQAAEWLRQLSAEDATALTDNSVGDALAAKGDVDGALRAYRAGLAVAQSLAQGNKTNALRQRDLAMSYKKIADTLKAKNDFDRALAFYQKDLSILRDLAKDGTNVLAQDDLLVSLDEIGDLKLRANDAAGALKAYEEMLGLARKLAEDKSNAAAQRDLSVSLDRIGDVKLRANDAAAALQAYEESLALRRKLAEDKSNALGQRDLSVSLNRIGDVKLRANDAAGALQAYEESLGLARKLAEDKSNALAQRDLSVSLIKIGDVRLRAGDAAGALQAYEEMLALARKLAEDKSNAQAQRYLALSLIKIGDVKLRADDAAGARQAYEESLGVARKLADDKSNAEAQRYLALSLERIGDVKLRAGDAAGALQAYEGSLALRRKLAEDKTNAEAQRDLSVSDEKIADALKKLDRLKEALPYNEEDLAISETLAKQDERDEAAQRDLAIALNRVGADLRKLGRLNEAFAHYDRALTIRRRLAAAHPHDKSAQNDLEDMAGAMGGLAYGFVLARGFDKSLTASDRAIAAAPDLVWLQTNRAHALMFLNRSDEARRLYLSHRGEKTQGDKIWEAEIREDFAELRKAGLTRPLMKEIEQRFAE